MKPALVLVILLAVLAAGCARVSKPTGWSTPEVDAGTLYVSVDRGKLSALDPTTYASQWQFPAGDQFACGSEKSQKHQIEGIYETPSFDDTTVYFGGYDGWVYAVDRATGGCKWRFETGDPIVGGTVLGDAGLYVPSEDGFLYLLNPADGSVKQKFASGDVWTTPLLTEDALYVDTMDGKLYKLNPETLAPLWDKPFSVSAALLVPPTLLGDDVVLVGGIGKKLYAVSTADGSQKWAVSGENWYWGRPATDGTTVYATNLGGEVQAIDGTNGSVIWKYDTLKSVRAGVVVTDGFIVAADNSGNVYRLSKDNGDLQGQPNELNETVYATPLLLTATAAASASPTPVASATASPTPAASGSPAPAPSGESGPTVLISTQSGHLWTLDVTLGRTTEVLS